MRTIKTMFALLVFAALVLTLPSCAALSGGAESVPQAYHQQELDFIDTVVEPVLLEHYVADPAVDQFKKDNIKAAVDEHRAAVVDFAASPTP